ncbi:NAD(+) diphosphatase [Noviherbaspirillum galbum]|uniref:NAD(+) diphosphatase n=1 Tax=Noviherbaspirillum galbum TaxID=2709383 RepID=A0A6B3SQK1_9BURK|nr:NAD(+) diphosphatase [Noviherbaspirillum galbum]NEX62921.1 NAD(+) diphosphatase [Noviherbaspirillum galbum]
MLQTPQAFSPLVRRLEHEQPHTFLFRGDELLLRGDDLTLPPATDAALLALPPERMHAVGMLEDRYCHAAWLDASVAPPTGYAFRKLRTLFGIWDDGMVALAGRAYQIVEWARTHRFCGACGTATAYLDHERCARCPQCGMTAYPRISPAMMVLVRRGDAILLARNAMSPTNRFSALAGFLEPGESVEEAVHREVMEEVGLNVTNLRYFGSQSWPFPHSLMIAFTADHAGGDIQVDPTEIAEARWVGPGDPLPEIAPDFSIAGRLIRAHLP